MTSFKNNQPGAQQIAYYQFLPVAVSVEFIDESGYLTIGIPMNLSQEAKGEFFPFWSNDFEVSTHSGSFIRHDIRERQQSTIELANKVDLMLVIGSHTSANTNHLAELCATTTETLLLETADEITPEKIEGHRHIGVTGGASTAEEAINAVIQKLESFRDTAV